MQTAGPAPYPSDTKAKGWRFELNYEQIEQSDTWALAAETPMAQHALLMMWMMAWKQEPCGSLPSDESLIRAKCRIPPEMWSSMRDILMRGWWLADDGRLYHPTITARVLEMMRKRRSDADRTATKRARDAKQDHTEVTEMSRVTQDGVRPEFDTGTRTDIKSKPDGLLVAGKPGDALPPCPQQKILDTFAEVLPQLPQPRIWEGQRAKNLAARWKWVLTASDRNGKRHATNAEEGVDFFRRFFAYVATCDFLVGRGKTSWSCDLGWLVKAENFDKVLSGNYQRQEEVCA
jgi:uncharacterized protein YdaU (DUF1376 family)